MRGKICLGPLNVAVVVTLDPVVEALDGKDMLKNRNLTYWKQILVANAMVVGVVVKNSINIYRIN